MPDALPNLRARYTLPCIPPQIEFNDRANLMKLAKAELSVAFVICTVVAAASMIYLNYNIVAKALTDPAEASLREQHEALTYATLGLLLAAALGSLLFIMPLLRRHNREHNKLHSLTGLLKERSQKLETAAFTDALTGMHNRRFFDEALTQYLAEFERIEKPVGLVLIDLDHFKAINDTHGHDIGDEVLRSVAYCLFEHTRFHDVVARIGGEEFAVIAPNLAQHDLHRFAEKLRSELSKLAIVIGEANLAITASIGAAVARPGDSVSAFIKRADVNLYQAKQSGRNRVSI